MVTEYDDEGILLMAITVMCPNLRCKRMLIIADGLRGKRMRCSYCDMQFKVPWARSFSGDPFRDDGHKKEEFQQKRPG